MLRRCASSRSTLPSEEQRNMSAASVTDLALLYEYSSPVTSVAHTFLSWRQWKVVVAERWEVEGEREDCRRRDMNESESEYGRMENWVRKCGGGQKPSGVPRWMADNKITQRWRGERRWESRGDRIGEKSWGRSKERRKHKGWDEWTGEERQTKWEERG